MILESSMIMNEIFKWSLFWLGYIHNVQFGN